MIFIYYNMKISLNYKEYIYTHFEEIIEEII